MPGTFSTNVLSLWVEEYLGDGEKARKDEWTGSIAVGSRPFVEKVKALLGIRAKGREVIEDGEGYQVRESLLPIRLFSGSQRAI